MSGTRAVIDFILETNIGDFPERLLSEGRRCVLDGTGVILAGSTDACSRIVQDQIAAQGGHAEATVLGLPHTRAPASLAARANGTAGHAMDFDDTQLSNAPDRIFGLLTHPTVAPLSAGYAVAERVGATGAEFLEANADEAGARAASDLEPDPESMGWTPGETPRYVEKLFWQPSAVKLDARGRLYVVDRNRHRIQVYGRAA